MKILFLSHTAAGGPFKVGSHQLSQQMVLLGHRVVHVSPPVTPAHLLGVHNPFERARIARWRRHGADVEGVRDLIPGSLVPWGIARRMNRPQQWFYRGYRESLRRLLRAEDLSRPDLVLIDEPRLVGALELLRPTTVIYRPTDLYAEIRNDPSILDVEHGLIQRAQGFVATSEPVAGHLKALGARNVLIVENGVDLQHFRAPADVAALDRSLPPGPRAIYVGAFDDRFGFTALECAAETNPQVTFLLGGPASTASRRRLSKPNVHWLGPLPYHDLPRYFAASQVGLLPLSESRSNQGRSPMKIYEYGASGLPVVASSTTELRRRQLSFVSLAESVEQFASAVTAALRVERRAEPSAEAVEHSWTAKAEEILQFAMQLGMRPQGGLNQPSTPGGRMGSACVQLTTNR